LQVSVDVPAELPLLFVHAALIEQALINVLENAARFHRPTVVCNCAPGPTTRNCFSRSATKGRGFRKPNGRKFSTCSTPPHAAIAAGRAPGLGLAICQGMVGAHGGQISVADGIEGRGTCITLHLPLQDQPDR
jgi:two-component system sensor histidine kinase KdpD